MKPAPGDVEYIGHERRFRCRYMFPPKINEDSSINSPETSVIVSQSANDLKNITSADQLVTSSETGSMEGEGEKNVEPGDLLSLWGGQ